MYLINYQRECRSYKLSTRIFFGQWLVSCDRGGWTIDWMMFRWHLHQPWLLETMAFIVLTPTTNDVKKLKEQQLPSIEECNMRNRRRKRSKAQSICECKKDAKVDLTVSIICLSVEIEGRWVYNLRNIVTMPLAIKHM